MNTNTQHFAMASALTAALTLGAAINCAGSKDHPPPLAPATEPSGDSSAQVTIQSAAKPNRNTSSRDPGEGEGLRMRTLVNDCDLEVCSGSAPDQLIEAIRTRATQAQACYEAALKDAPTLAGRTMLALRIAHDGKSCPLRALENELTESKTLLGCLRKLLEIDYPRPERGCVELNLPLRFVPEYVDAGT